MNTAPNITISLNLDAETIGDLGMVRDIRLGYYRSVLRNPETALETLKQAGLTEVTSSAQVAAYALTKIQELEARISDPTLIYDDEISLYVNSLTEVEASEEV